MGSIKFIVGESIRRNRIRDPIDIEHASLWKRGVTKNADTGCRLSSSSNHIILKKLDLFAAAGAAAAANGYT